MATHKIDCLFQRFRKPWTFISIRQLPDQANHCTTIFQPDTCVGSNLFRAFSEHFLYRMNIKQLGPVIENNQPKIRITLLQRGNPKKSNVFRQIRNQPQLVKALSRLENIELKVRALKAFVVC